MLLYLHFVLLLVASCQASRFIARASVPYSSPSFTSLSAAPPAPTSSSPPLSNQVCNNSSLLCGRTCNNITHLGAHDSAFLRDAPNITAIAGDQYFSATRALSAGIRLLQAQVHMSSNGVLHLCHSTCGLLDAGPLEAWLGLIRGWMDANPHDVVTLLLVNSDHQPASSFGRIFETAGLAKYGFTLGTIRGGWPTLQTMITANTRLLTFVASIAPDAAYPWLLKEFDHVFEAPYMITGLAQFNNCSLDRPLPAGSAASALKAGMLPLMNHFAYVKLGDKVQVPDVSNIDITNSPDVAASGAASGTLGTQARLCTAQWGVKPTFALVDFFNRGPAISTADGLNGLGAGSVAGRVITQDLLQGRKSSASRKMSSWVAWVPYLALIAWAAA